MASIRSILVANTCSRWQGARGESGTRGSLLTLRWREQDSNHRSRGDAPRRVVCRFSCAPTFSVGGELSRGDIQRLVVSRGTDGSNPAPSGGEMLWGRRRRNGTIVAALN